MAIARIYYDKPNNKWIVENGDGTSEHIASEGSRTVTPPKISGPVQAKYGTTITLTASGALTAFSDSGVAIDYYEWQLPNNTYSHTSSVNYTLPDETYVGETETFKCRAVDTLGNSSVWVEHTVTITDKDVLTITCDTGNSLYPHFNLSPSFSEVSGTQGNWQSTEWQIATDSNFANIVKTYSITDSVQQSELYVTDDILNVNTNYYIRARYHSDSGYITDWSGTYNLTTGLYELEYTLPTQENEQTIVNIQVTHDSGRTFNTTNYTLNGSVTAGTLTISGMTVSWTLPDVTEDTIESITLWVIRNSDSIEVTEHVQKSLLVKVVNVTADNAIVITNFDSNSENDGWDTAA